MGLNIVSPLPPYGYLIPQNLSQDLGARIIKEVPSDLPPDPQWVTQRRKISWQQFIGRGLPSTKTEDWKYTNIIPLTDGILSSLKVPQDDRQDEFPLAQLSAINLGLLSSSTLTFLNGHFCQEISNLTVLPKEITVTSLRSILGDPQRPIGEMEKKFQEYGNLEGLGDSFDLLNQVFFQDGAYIKIPEGVEVQELIQIVSITNHQSGEVNQEQSALTNIIEIGKGSQCQIAMTHLDLNLNPHSQTHDFSNLLTWIKVGRGAKLRFCNIMLSGEKASLRHKTVFTQQEESQLSVHNFVRGGGMVRNEMQLDLEGSNAQYSVNGLYTAGNKKHADNHILINHHAPHCEGKEYFKGIIDDGGHGIFTGKIVVDKMAQKTDAQQLSKTLLLSNQAVAHARPHLEIYADDVKCKHGATVGQLDEQELFYLRTRGIEEKEARTMLISAFAEEMLEQLPPEISRELLKSELLKFVALEKNE